MFTGLIQEIGIVGAVTQTGENLHLSITASQVLEKAKIGASIAVNGVCLTATTLSSHQFSADVMPESWMRSNLKYLKVGDKVNLEKSITLATPLGGHLVYGDVDSIASIESITREGIATQYQFSVAPKWMKYIALKGRVSIDGASLTVMQRSKKNFSVSLIPHSKKNLLLGSLKVGDKVNIETDMIAKYCETLLMAKEDLAQKQSGLTLAHLTENGFL